MSDLTQSKIRTGTKFFYAMGEFPGGYLTTLLSFFFLIYMTDFIKISPAWAGLILFLGFVFDGITDPLAGYMSDKSRHPFGRRRIYMLATIIPLGAVFCALFIIPSLVVSAAPWVRILVILVVYFVYILLYTFYTTPYFAIINDMTDSYDERTSMMSWRMSLSILAVLISVLIPDFLGLSDVQTFSFEGFALMGGIFGFLVISSGLVSIFGIRERKGIVPEIKKFSIKAYFLDSWRCAPFRQACLAYFCSFACLAAINTCLIYYLNYYIQLPELFLPIAGGVMIIAIAFLPFWNAMCKKFGKKKSLIAGALTISAGLLLLATVKANLSGVAGAAGELTTISLTLGQSLAVFPVQAYLATLLISCGFSSLQMVSSAIIPDAINFSADKQKDEGAYYGVVTFVFKIGTGLASLLIGLILEITGYIEPPASMAAGQILVQPASAKTGILLVFIALPCLLSLLSILFLKNYKIDRLKLERKVKEAKNSFPSSVISCQVSCQVSQSYEKIAQKAKKNTYRFSSRLLFVRGRILSFSARRLP